MLDTSAKKTPPVVPITYIIKIRTHLKTHAMFAHSNSLFYSADGLGVQVRHDQGHIFIHPKSVDCANACNIPSILEHTLE